MEEDTDFELKKICCICLSIDRKLMKLCKINDGVNNLYFLLSYDPEAFKEGFLKEPACLWVCWECRALLRRMASFRAQACVAQKRLSNTKMKHLRSLSRLSACHSCAYDVTIEAPSSDAEGNFVDCDSVKVETDEMEDMPLSYLRGFDGENCSDRGNAEDPTHENNMDNVTITKPALKSAKKYKSNEKFNKKKSRTKKKSKNEESEILEEKGLCEKDETALIDASNKCKPYVEGFESQIELEDPNFVKHIEGAKKTLGRKAGGGVTTDQRTALGYQCAECNKYFENKNQRWKHVQKSHREGYSCHACGKRFAFRHTLARHELLHSGSPAREECPVCGKMVRVDLRGAHARTHAPRRAYSCAACAKTFVSHASYQHHLKYTMSHTNMDILKYKCSVCGKGYRSRGELSDHDNYQHQGRAQHQCPVCGKGLATRRCVTRHVRRAHDRIKEGARDKICQQCGKGFRDKKGLREHEWRHTGARPLSCGDCAQTFRQSAALYTHRRRVHRALATSRGQPQVARTDKGESRFTIGLAENNTLPNVK